MHLRFMKFLSCCIARPFFFFNDQHSLGNRGGRGNLFVCGVKTCTGLSAECGMPVFFLSHLVPQGQEGFRHSAIHTLTKAVL